VVVTVRVEVPVPLSVTPGLVGLTLAIGPAGLTEGERFTAPENPLKLVRVTVDVAVPPGVMIEDTGPTDIPKSQATYVLVCAE
jgi:hypothetical protein